MKKRKINITAALSVLLFTAIMVWLAASAGNADEAAQKNRSDALRKSVMNGAAMCYSIEGEYPRELEYIEENYGVRIDRERYTVHYEYFGANIAPTVTVTEKGKGRQT